MKFIWIGGLVAVVGLMLFFMLGTPPAEETAAASESDPDNWVANVVALVRRRAVRKPTISFYLDRDGDGKGNPATKQVLGPGGAQPGWVTDNTDCNDNNAKVFRSVGNLAPDCNLNGVADDSLPTTVCVGNSQQKSVIYYPPGGGTAARVVTFYEDSKSQAWVAAAGGGDSASGACSRI